MGCLEVIGVASILPFMQLIAAPDAINQSSWLKAIYDLFEFSSSREMLMTVGIGIIAFIGFTNLFSVFTVWLQYKYSWGIAHNLSTRLLQFYLKKPYSFYLKSNTADLKTYIVSEVVSLTGGVLIPLIEICSRMFASIVIFSLLLVVDTKIALVMFTGLGGAYFLIYLSRQQYLKNIGQHRINMNLLRFKSLYELLEGIKTVMVYNERSFFFKRFEKASEEFCDVQPKYNLILAAPKYVLEFLAFGSILGITIYLYLSSGNIQSAIPRLTLYAVAGYRLLPALQKTFAAASKIKHNIPVLDRLHPDLVASLSEKPITDKKVAKMTFDEILNLNRINFNYEGHDQQVIQNLSVDIEKGQRIAFIGSTGTGKTTLVDIIVGLLQPTKGNILVDDKKLEDENLQAWQNNIAYVPQDVFLFDDTILRNIVLGQAAEDIDMAKVKKAAQLADIYKFILNDLPDGFDAKIGERGLRLSGGQRQRLGLARALYRNPSVLVLDEATSALDSITEQGIIESLNALPENLTTIIIAHRLSTVRHVDCIYLLKDGKIIDRGNYQSLMASNDTFKTMVELS